MSQSRAFKLWNKLTKPEAEVASEAREARMLLDRENKKKARELIRSEMRRGEEKKVQELTTNVFYLANAINTTGFSAQNVWEATNSPGGAGMQIAQGTGAGNRIGNKITITKALAKIVLMPYPYTATYNTVPKPQDVRIIVFKLKGLDRSLANAQAMFSTTGSCFQSNNSSAGLGGDVVDMVRKLNGDTVTVYKDFRVKVGAASWTDGASGAIGAAGYFANNDYKYNQFITIDLLKNGMPKVWDFNDTSTTPYGYNPLYIVVDPVNCDGTAHTNTTNGRALYATYQLDLEFTDA